MEITSLNNNIIKDAAKLHQKKYRDMHNLFLIEGEHLYEEAIKFGIIKHVFTVDRSLTGENVFHVTNQIIDKISKTKTPQKVVCVCHKVDNKEILDRVLILREIQDPGNLGTLLRSALAFGFKTIILDNSVDLYNDKVIRSTQGTLFNLNIIEMSISDFMQKNPNHLVFGTSLNGTPLNKIDFPEKLAIILGNEGSGLSSDILEKTHQNISIKTSDVNSLNVGVAGSIIMHQINNI